MTGSSDEFVLAVDCGAQSVRALLVDLAAAVGLGLRRDFSAAAVLPIASRFQSPFVPWRRDTLVGHVGA